MELLHVVGFGISSFIMCRFIVSLMMLMFQVFSFKIYVSSFHPCIALLFVFLYILCWSQVASFLQRILKLPRYTGYGMSTGQPQERERESCDPSRSIEFLNFCAKEAAVYADIEAAFKSLGCIGWPETSLRSKCIANLVNCLANVLSPQGTCGRSFV